MSQKTSTPLGIHLIAGGTAGFAEVGLPLVFLSLITRSIKTKPHYDSLELGMRVPSFGHDQGPDAIEQKQAGI
jgi:hypothetical protein